MENLNPDDIYLDIEDGNISEVYSLQSDIDEDELLRICDNYIPVDKEQNITETESVPHLPSDNFRPFLISDENVPPSKSDINPSCSKSSNQVQPNTNSSCSKTNKKREWSFRKVDFEPPDTLWGTSIPLVDDQLHTPMEYVKVFITDDTLNEISNQSNLYAHQKDGVILNCTKADIEQFFGILLHTGIVKMSSRRMYWSNECRYPPVADVMSRNRFEQLMKYFHIVDNANQIPNTSPEHDKLFKVRPLLNSLAESMRSLAPEEYHSIDEQIIPFKGRSCLKQYIKSKPHKWGFKVFMRAGSSGLMYDFKIYAGKGTCNDFGLGFSGDIVMALCEGLPQGQNFKVFFDNWFSSLQLAVALKEKQLFCVGTIRADRIGKCKLLSEKELKCSGRGSKDWSVEREHNIALVRWFDRKSINFISTYAAVEPESTCKRYKASENKRVDIPQPSVVKEYNKFMGGVDKADMLLELYRINMKSRKWYMRIVYWCLGVAVVNGWLLYRRHQDQLGKKYEYSLLRFQADAASALCKAGKMEKKKGRPSAESSLERKTKKYKVSTTPVLDIRYDNIAHWPDYETKQGRCKFCPKGYAHIYCKKCNAYLCLTPKRNCFKDFHSK